MTGDPDMSPVASAVLLIVVGAVAVSGGFFLWGFSVGAAHGPILTVPTGSTLPPVTAQLGSSCD